MATPQNEDNGGTISIPRVKYINIMLDMATLKLRLEQSQETVRIYFSNYYLFIQTACIYLV